MNSPADKVLTYAIHDVTPYINWIYFFHAWGFRPKEEDRAKASEAMQLLKEANRMLNQLDENYRVHTIFRLCKANADGDNLLLDGTRFPLLRQQIPHPMVVLFSASAILSVPLLPVYLIQWVFLQLPVTEKLNFSMRMIPTNVCWYRHLPTDLPKLPPKKCMNTCVKLPGGTQRTKTFPSPSC